MEYFEQAVQRNDLLEIKLIGERLVFNEHLTQVILERLNEAITTHKKSDSQRDELSNGIMNKQLHFDCHFGKMC